MKKVLLLCLLAFSSRLFAQDAALFTPPLKDGSIFYEKVVTVTGKSQDDIYSRAFDWYMKNFRTVDDDLTVQDNKMGQLVAKASVPFSAANNDYVATFDLQIDCKDGKYRLRAFNFKRTLKSLNGITETPENSMYIHNYPMDNDIAIENGGVKGFTRGSQKQAATLRLTNLDSKINYLIQDLNSYITKKAEDF